jgi:hypothetical protein
VQEPTVSRVYGFPGAVAVAFAISDFGTAGGAFGAAVGVVGVAVGAAGFAAVARGVKSFTDPRRKPSASVIVGGFTGREVTIDPSNTTLSPGFSPSIICCVRRSVGPSLTNRISNELSFFSTTA